MGKLAAPPWKLLGHELQGVAVRFAPHAAGIELVHGKTIREAITLEFGPGALLVLRESQAWFRERVHRFLKEGGDPAF